MVTVDQLFILSFYSTTATTATATITLTEQRIWLNHKNMLFLHWAIGIKKKRIRFGYLRLQYTCADGIWKWCLPTVLSIYICIQQDYEKKNGVTHAQWKEPLSSQLIIFLLYDFFLSFNFFLVSFSLNKTDIGINVSKTIFFFLHFFRT